MASSFKAAGFDTSHYTEGMWKAMEDLRSSFDKRVGNRMGTRMGRGDVRAAVLALLAEEPMHGYQIIHKIAERTDGSWKPSAGSVYPTLQLLADEGLIVAEESNGRKTYTLTDAGREEVANSSTSAPWDTKCATSDNGFTALPKAGVELARAASQVGRTGTPAQVKEAVAVIDDARRRIYAILAQD